MNRSRRESLNCLNAAKADLDLYAAHEQRQVDPATTSHNAPTTTSPDSSTMQLHRPGSQRSRSKSLAYGLTWAQAMGSGPIDPRQVFSIANTDEIWSGPWTAPAAPETPPVDKRKTVEEDIIEFEPQLNNRGSLVGSGLGSPGGGGGAGAAPSLTMPPVLGAVEVMKKSTVQSWEHTLERSIRAIVSITANHVRSFDTETSGAYSATGFLVDAKRGIILTNRHVVSPAPIIALAVLSNYEEVELKPIYRDPVHDFGFMQFDTSKVRFMQLEEIPLSPERARVGLEIRVVGNDAGEKLSILAGTLARLDRPAPEYGQGEYNDFNTFYLQAASSTSGGSSGSPVLDIEGHAVALNAGGASKASASYYLPLDRVKRALRYIQEGLNVPRGTLQTEFEYFPYDELRRLGLKTSIEEALRKEYPDETGMLVVKQVLPKGPAADKLIPGDILIKVNGKYATNFISVFSVLDDSVGKEVELTIVRGTNSQMMTMKFTVQDLHSITPDRYVEIGGGVVNELSYQLARSYGQPCGGVYVATSGHMLASASAWRKSIIVAVNNVPTPNLDAFIDAVCQLPDGARVPIRFYTLQKAFKEKIMIMHVDRHWHRARVAVRNDKTGLWDYCDLPPPPPSSPYQPATAFYPKIDPALHPAPVLMPSFVAIDFHLPFLVDGMKATQFYGTGLVVSTDPPMIVCDRDTIPISIGDIFITFANSVIIPGRLMYLHPHYNFVVVTYDPKLIADTPVRAATFSDKSLHQGDECYLVGVGTDQSPVIKRTTVSNVGNIGTRECSPPRWRAMNVEGIKIDDPVSTQGGVLCDQDGRVQALWVNYSSQDDKGKDITFMSGLDISAVKTVTEPLKRGQSPNLRGLDVEFWTMRIAAARSLGLSDYWVRRIESDPNSKHSLIYVLSLLDATTACSRMLRVGDIILELEGKVATSMKDLERARDKDKVQMVVLREGQELCLNVPTVSLEGAETDRIIGWAGALVQMPYKAVLEQVANVPSGVYVSCTLYGSPASTALRPGVWITEVDGIPVSNLDEFLDAVHRHERKVVRSRQGSLCCNALKRLSLNKDKRLSSEVLNSNYQAAMAAGAAAQAAAQPPNAPAQPPKTSTMPVIQDTQSVHPYDTTAPGPAVAPPPPGSFAEGYNQNVMSPVMSPTMSPSLDKTLEEDLAQGQGYVRLKTVSRNEMTAVCALKLDPIFWGTWELTKDPTNVSGWKSVDLM
ncbi:serine protease [Actinomortierella wolfii]|nr:serine protease [Actinomortierella wolfii]